MANRFAEPVFLASGGTDLYKIGTATEIQYRATGTRNNMLKLIYIIIIPPNL